MPPGFFHSFPSPFLVTVPLVSALRASVHEIKNITITPEILKIEGPWLISGVFRVFGRLNDKEAGNGSKITVKLCQPYR